MTVRPSSPALDALLGRTHPVLNHGYVRVVDYMGNDEAIVQAARVSYGAGTKSTRDDRALIRYLLRHRHTTPFEMTVLKLHVKLPIFVARQWIRHRTASVNEYSARYSILDREFYLPSEEAIADQSRSNKQGRGAPLGTSEATRVVQVMLDDAEAAYVHYLELLNQDEDGQASDPRRSGVARELARAILPVSVYTQWYWKIDLHNLLHFLEVRLDRHAQYEIRQYAAVILDIVKVWVPLTYEAFVDYRLGRFELSKSALEIVRRMVAGEKVDFEASGLSRREWDELTAVIRQ